MSRASCAEGMAENSQVFGFENCDQLRRVAFTDCEIQGVLGNFERAQSSTPGFGTLLASASRASNLVVALPFVVGRMWRPQRDLIATGLRGHLFAPRSGLTLKWRTGLRTC